MPPLAVQKGGAAPGQIRPPSPCYRFRWWCARHHNVDPSTTIQVVNALTKANKDFDFLYVPGADHGNGGRPGVHKRNDFFVEDLLGVRAPDRDHTSTTEEGSE